MNYLVPNENESYQKYILNIIDIRGLWNIPNYEYYEKHHILALCMGGTGDNYDGSFKKGSKHNNCIWLYAQEHFYAHKLLALENPDNKGLHDAWWLMCNKYSSKNLLRYYEVSADEYAMAKLLHSNNMIGSNNPNCKEFTTQHKQNISNSLKGKDHSNYKKRDIDHNIESLRAKKGWLKRKENNFNSLYNRDFYTTRKIINLSTNEIFDNALLASKLCNLSESTILAICRGNVCVSKNNYWLFLNDLNHIRINKRKKPILCITSGVIYDSIADVYRLFNITSTLLNLCLLYGLPYNNLFFKFLNQDYIKVRIKDSNNLFNSVQDAAEKLNLDAKDILNSCQYNKPIYENVFEFIDYNHKQKVDKRCKLIICIETNTIYYSVNQLCELLNIDRHYMNNACKNNISINNFHYKYL